MSDSTTQLDTISSSQAQKEVSANALFDAMSPAAIFGRRASTSAALTFGYYGGDLWVDGVLTTVANGTVALSASTTNYVEATRAGVVSKNTTGFTAGQIPLYTIVTGASTVTSYTDHRLSNTPFFGRLVKSVAGGAGDTTLTAAEARADSFEFTGALTGNRNVILPTVPWQKQFFNNTSGAFTLTVKTIAGTGIAVTQGKRATLECDGTNVVVCDTDGNSAGLEVVSNKATGFGTVNDTLYPSVQAVKTYVDTAVTGLLDFKGTTDCSANPNYPAASKGDFYVVSVGGKIGGASGTVVEAGDAYYAAADNAGGTEASVGANWAHAEHNLTLGTMATQNANAVAITGGTIAGLTGFDFPASTFAGLPAASTVSGQTWRVSDVGPAPGILLTSNGTIWRPAGGRQVLAMRSNNQVTVQDLAGAVAETIGPFPGGLVRNGMKLEMDVRVSLPGIGTAARTVTLRIGTGATRIIYSLFNTIINSIASNKARVNNQIDILSDTNSAHAGGVGGNLSFSTGLGTYSPTVDFSAAWSTDIFLQSSAETAVNITAASWAAGVATYTATAHTLAVGDKTVIAGITPSGYNIAAGGIVLTVPDANTFTIAVAADPGAYTSGGTTSRISNMISQSYVLYLIG